MFNRPQGSGLLCSKPNTPFYEPSFTTTLPHWHQSQPGKRLFSAAGSFLGQFAVNASESNCAHFLDARLELFWAEDWSALRATVRAECDIAPVQNATRRTLARTGEKGRALAAARNAPPVPVTEQIVQEIKKSQPNRSRTSSTCVSSSVSPVLVRSSRAHPYYTPKNASTQ